MRIGICIAELDKAGGTNRVVVNLANTFEKKLLNVQLISIHTTNGKTYYPLNGKIAVQHLGVKLYQNVIARSSVTFIKTIVALIKVARNVDVLIATDPITCFAFSFLKKKFPGKKFIACEHMGIAVSAKHSLLARKLLYKYVDAVVVLNERDKVLLQQNVTMKHCFVIPNQVSFYPSESAACINKKMVTVGRYVPQKGYDILIDILKEVMPANKDWSIDIVGDGYMKQELNDKINSYGLQHQVKLIEPTKNVAQLYIQASAYLMPSRFEGFPMVLLEAKACGLPCISFDCPAGPAEIIEDNDGIVIPLFDKQAFGGAMQLLIDNESLRISMGRHAKQNVKKFSEEAIYDKWDNLFKTVFNANIA